MTYNSRGRSLTEVIVAVGLVSFLIGFVAVLCVGNYYRAKQAMERQKHKRLARLSGHRGNGVVGIDSPRSDKSTTSTQFHDELLPQQQDMLAINGRTNMGTTSRRRTNDEIQDSLLLDVNATGPRAQLVSM